jgi:hypothetical protein
MLPNIIGRIHPPTPSSLSDLCAVSTALKVAELDMAFGIVSKKRTYYCYCERRDEAIQWMTALRLACRLGDMAIPVGRPLIAGQDEGAFKERFLVQSPARALTDHSTPPPLAEEAALH